MIPKRIIQSGPVEIPLLLKAAISNVRLLHPTFEYMLFDDAGVERFVEEHFPQHWRAYNAFPFRIQKYDFFRYLAIYHYGGFYLDLDMFLAQELTSLLEYEAVFAFEELSPLRYLWKKYRMDWQIGNYAFGAAAGHPFLAAIIENCLRASVDRSWTEPMMTGIPRPLRSRFVVLNSTGPGLVSRTFAENQSLINNNVKILSPSDIRDTQGWHRFGEFGVHLMASSWSEHQGLFMRVLKRAWYAGVLKRMLRESSGRGAKRIPVRRDETEVAQAGEQHPAVAVLSK